MSFVAVHVGKHKILMSNDVIKSSRKINVHRSRSYFGMLFVTENDGKAPHLSSNDIKGLHEVIKSSRRLNFDQSGPNLGILFVAVYYGENLTFELQ